MERPNPLVSICMATCLRSDLFPESLKAALLQTYEPLEILVLADGSNKESLEILKNCIDPRLRWMTTPHPSGMVPAWNRVCSESKGKYFLFCADDDVLMPKAIDQQVELLERSTEVDFCHADFAFIDDEGRELGTWVSHEGTWIKSRHDEWPRYLVHTRCCMQTTVVRRQAWDAVGGWDEDAGNPGDNSLYLKLLRHGDVGHVAHLACRYRIRTRNPDTWEKKVRNLKEYHVLALKHLANPPPFVGTLVDSIRRNLSAHLSKMTYPLLLSSDAAAAEKKEFRDWVKAEIWSCSATGRFANLLESLHLLGILEISRSIEGRLRSMARAVFRRA
jgi:glycosyltransferase involved in cell wall biosynthesis